MDTASRIALDSQLNPAQLATLKRMKEWGDVEWYYDIHDRVAYIAHDPKSDWTFSGIIWGDGTLRFSKDI